ncbi:MAG: hypothetical protein WD425_07450 [Nitrospirales bacterium]
MSKHFAHVVSVSIGIMVVALAWSMSPLLTKLSNAEIAIDRAEPSVLLTSAFKIVSQGGQVRTIISFWDGASPFLAAVEGQGLPQRSCLTYKKNVTHLVIREIRETREWLTNLHSLAHPGMMYESHMTCASTFSPRMKRGARSVSVKGPDTPAAVSTLVHESSRPHTFFLNGKDNDERVFAIY